MATESLEESAAKSLLEARLSRREVLRGAAWLGLTAGPASAFLAACGQQASPSNPPSGPGRFNGRTIKVMMIQPHALAGKILAQDFQTLTGARVDIVDVPYDQIQQKATLDVQSGANQFDVFDYWHVSVGALAKDHILEDLTDFIAKDPDINPKDYIASIYDSYTFYQGRRWGLPFDGDSHMLFYNLEIFGRHGLKAPNTWDEYTEAAHTITEAESKSGIYGCAILGRQDPIDIGSSYTNRLAGFGGSYLSPSGQPTLNSDAAIAAAGAMLQAAPHALPTPLTTGFDQALPAFLSGKVAMIEFWSDLGVYSQDPKGSKIIDKWDVVQLPVGGKNTVHRSALDAGFGMGVSAGSKNKDVARQFVKFACSKTENLKLITTTGSGIDPTHISTLESDQYKTFAPKIQKAATASLNGALDWPTVPVAPTLMQKLADQLALMLQGKKTPEQAIADAQAAWKQTLGA